MFLLITTTVVLVIKLSSVNGTMTAMRDPQFIVCTDLISDRASCLMVFYCSSSSCLNGSQYYSNYITWKGISLCVKVKFV